MDSGVVASNHPENRVNPSWAGTESASFQALLARSKLGPLVENVAELVTTPESIMSLGPFAPAEQGLTP